MMFVWVTGGELWLVPVAVDCSWRAEPGRCRSTETDHHIISNTHRSSRTWTTRYLPRPAAGGLSLSPCPRPPTPSRPCPWASSAAVAPPRRPPSDPHLRPPPAAAAAGAAADVALPCLVKSARHTRGSREKQRSLSTLTRWACAAAAAAADDDKDYEEEEDMVACLLTSSSSTRLVLLLLLKLMGRPYRHESSEKPRSRSRASNDSAAVATSPRSCSSPSTVLLLRLV